LSLKFSNTATLAVLDISLLLNQNSFLMSFDETYDPVSREGDCEFYEKKTGVDFLTSRDKGKETPFGFICTAKIY